jgi:hypothetical protein
MRCPSLKTLRAMPGLDKLADPDGSARAVRVAMLKCAGGVLSPMGAMIEIDKALDGFGVVEVSRDRNSGRAALYTPRFFYSNQGDTYTTTIVFYVPTRSFRVTSWGDVVEADERRGIKYA